MFDIFRHVFISFLRIFPGVFISIVFLIFNFVPVAFIYLFIFNLFIVDKILFQFTIILAFHKQQGLSQTPGAINNIAECWYRWQQTFETESQFVVLIKVN